MKWATTLTAAAVAVCLASVEGVCSNGFIDLGDEGGPEVCILFLRVIGSWQNMRIHCEALGGTLAKLTGNLHQRVIEYIDDQPASDLKDESFWIGGTDEAEEGSWKWIADNTTIPLGTPHWYPCKRHAEPDGGTNQNYLCLTKPDFHFHSCDGQSQFYGICQII